MSVKRHASYNLIGALIPIGLSLLTVPLYLKQVGPDRYGVLAIAWLLLGYFGLFDLGLGRATSFRVASLRDASREARAATFWSALCVNAAIGLVGGVVLWFAAGYFFEHVLKVRESLRPEILRGVPMLAASVPIATVTGVLTGAMQGREKFLETNIISVLSTALFQLLPLSTAYMLGPDLPLLLTAAVGARVFAIVVLAFRCHQELLKGVRPKFHPEEIPLLLKFGGWVNLTSIVGPVLVIVDRFAIGAILGAAQLAVYTVPFQLAQRIAIVPGALTNALFPRMAASDDATRDVLAQRATQTLACVVSPMVLLGVLALEPFLHVWVGADLATKAAPIGRVLFVGFWANAFALIPFIFLQSSGRPDLPPKMHLLEIPFYLAGLYGGMKYFGLLGCALAYSGRCIVDYLLLGFAAKRRYHHAVLLLLNFAILCVALVVCQFATLHEPVWWLMAAGTLSAATVLSWMNLPPELKLRALDQVGGRLRRAS
ncbi:flippase [Phenylobacterium sp.]|uniref:flippase n=1 Tax=Phenylobacterium sp. TaxID=1871053 RepID=UPI0025D56EAA|nr:flippase [Phenylobacterium sp.]